MEIFAERSLQSPASESVAYGMKEMFCIGEGFTSMN